MHLGNNPFAGSSPEMRALRLRILSQMPEHQINFDGIFQQTNVAAR